MYNHRHIGFVVLAVIISIAIGGETRANEYTEHKGMELAVIPSSQLDLIPSSQVVQGKVINIEGYFLSGDRFTLFIDEVYVVRNGSGKKHRLKLNESVTIIGEINMGDEIIAQLSKEGLVIFVEKTGR